MNFNSIKPPQTPKNFLGQTMKKSASLKNSLWIGVLLICIGTFTTESFAIQGPEHKSLRPLAMGNAFVALVDNKDAIYYNPAGLNLMGRLGNRKRRPEMGYYPSNYIDMHLNFFGAGLPFGTAFDLYKLYQKHDTSFTGGLEELQNDQTLSSDLIEFDRQPINFALLFEGELAVHNFGGAIWADVEVSPFLDVGIVLPQAGIERIKADAVMEVGMAYPFLRDRLSLGIGGRIAFRETITQVQIGVGDLPDINNTVKDTLENHYSLISDISRVGLGLNLGFLWQQTRTLRFGGAVQNLLMELNGEKVTPEYTVGLAWSPMIFQNNYRWKRKINFALDYEDFLEHERAYMPLSKINFGAEWEQTLIPHILKGRISGGFKGGYLSAGLGGNLLTFLHYEFATWAEEGGYYTGQKEERYYVMKFGLGF